MLLGVLSKQVQKLYGESLYSYPYIIHYWCQEQNSTEFNQLLIDDNVDPQFNYSTFDSQIKDKAIQMVMKNK